MVSYERGDSHPPPVTASRLHWLDPRDLKTALLFGSFLRKGEVLAYVGRIHNLKDLKVVGTRFRGGLVIKAHRLFYHSTLGSRVIKKKKKSQYPPPSGRQATPWHYNRAALKRILRKGFGARAPSSPNHGGSKKFFDERLWDSSLRMRLFSQNKSFSWGGEG